MKFACECLVAFGKLQVEPKKKKLAEAQEVLDRTMSALNEAKRKLEDVLERVTLLEDQFGAARVSPHLFYCGPGYCCVSQSP